MTTAVALEHVIFRALLALSGVGVGMQSIALDRCHVCGHSLRTLIMPKNTMVIQVFLVFYDVHVFHICTPSRGHAARAARLTRVNACGRIIKKTNIYVPHVIFQQL